MRLKKRKTYNDYNRILEERSYGTDGHIEDKRINKYDDHGNYIELLYENIPRLRRIEHSEYTLMDSIVHKVDSVKRSFETLDFYVYTHDTIPSSHIIELYDNHWMKTSVYTFVDGKKILSEKTDYEYDPQGHLIEKTGYFNGEVSSHEDWRYNEKRRSVQHKYRYSANQEDQIDTSIYDAKGNLIEFHGTGQSSKNKIYYK